MSAATTGCSIAWRMSDIVMTDKPETYSAGSSMSLDPAEQRARATARLKDAAGK